MRRLRPSRSPFRRQAVVALSCGAALGSVVSDVAQATAVSKGVGTSTVKVHRTIPKDRDAFTEGLQVHKGVLYESVGLYGSSQIRVVDLRSGRVTKRQPLDRKYFGEGLTVLPDGQLVQLTWNEQVAFRRDPISLKETSTFTYEGEGWGVCFDSSRKRLVMSDGSDLLRFRDPSTFAELGSVRVKRPDGSPVMRLNELECEGPTVFANVWTTNEIVQIDLRNGTVVRSIDASSIVPVATTSPDDVLNGIAALGKGRYLLTGKRWPSYLEVSFVDPK